MKQHWPRYLCPLADIVSFFKQASCSQPYRGIHALPHSDASNDRFPGKSLWLFHLATLIADYFRWHWAMKDEGNAKRRVKRSRLIQCIQLWKRFFSSLTIAMKRDAS
jgi:hypothetical protein